MTHALDTLPHDLMRTVAETDPEIAQAVRDEVGRQNTGLELIASENFVSAAVLEVMGSVLTNKYAEGYPGRRYYGGCEFVDVAEQLAIERVKTLFGGRPCERSASLGRSGEHGGVFRAPSNRATPYWA